jgi:serine O-acetyltransferase
MLLLGEDVLRHTWRSSCQEPERTIFCYPGIFAITNHRIAHELYKLGVPIIPRIISENAPAPQVDIHPGAKIGRSFFIDHGTGGLVRPGLPATARIYQGVTLGAKASLMRGAR